LPGGFSLSTLPLESCTFLTAHFNRLLGGLDQIINEHGVWKRAFGQVEREGTAVAILPNLE
jgi:hypothetical protein